MKESLQPGVSMTAQIVVDKERTIGFMGEEGRVYATPFFVRDIEQTCRNLLLPHSSPGEDSVGMELSVRHTAPSLPGMKVEVTASVAAVDGRKVTFNITAHDDVEPIGTATHTRFVVDVAKTIERLKAKAAKRSGGSVG